MLVIDIKYDGKITLTEYDIRFNYFENGAPDNDYTIVEIIETDFQKFERGIRYECGLNLHSAANVDIRNNGFGLIEVRTRNLVIRNNLDHMLNGKHSKYRLIPNKFSGSD